MVKSNYNTKLKEAAQTTADKRWLPISMADTAKEMYYIYNRTECDLCYFQRIKWGKDKYFTCEKCPLHQEGYDTRSCCKDFSDWKDACSKNKFSKAQKASIKLVKRLYEIIEG